jgi:DNA processing protein
MSTAQLPQQNMHFNFSPHYAPIAPFKEIAAYEALWSSKEASFRSLAELFANHPSSRPSDFVRKEMMDEFKSLLKHIVSASNKINILINGTLDYPEKLKDAREPVELLYYTGNIDFIRTRGFSIVGTRKPSPEGLAVTHEIATKLVQDDFTIISGLALGIDTQAHKSTILAGGRTIGVIGTPLNKFYPRENAGLQKKIADDHLLLSQVPFYRYSKQPYYINKNFFLERNKTMSALSEATLIVEAGETSGSLTQAVAAVHQKRKLFIWEACFNNEKLRWPQKFADKGAIRVSSYEQIKEALLNK